MPRRRRAAIIVLLVATGCGGSDSPGSRADHGRDGVRATLRAVAAAYRSNNYTDLCGDLVTATPKAAGFSGSCEDYQRAVAKEDAQRGAAGARAQVFDGCAQADIHIVDRDYASAGLCAGNAPFLRYVRGKWRLMTDLDDIPSEVRSQLLADHP